MGFSSQFIPEANDLDPLSRMVQKLQYNQGSDDSLNSRLAEVLEKMADEWHAGSERPAELWLAEHAELNANPEDAVRIVYEEYCLREERGEQLDPQQYLGRFPQWHDQLAIVFQCHELLRNEDPPRFPQAGQCLGELRLISELGRGALGRVFLATQPSLSDRLMVVKITPRRGQEHLSLARLQHTHIVPLYLVQDFPRENLRAICMPFLGGASWGAILKRLQKLPVARRSGEQIVQRLFDTQAFGADASSAAAGPAVAFLAQSSYIDAVCWIGACLADALNYAHQRGMVHLDVKPSNVLLTADGQPMLLDFHIACELEHLQSETIDRVGGTLEYMSPEQRAAAEAIRRGDSIPGRLDARSDIYSVGVLLYESLAGQLPVADPVALRRNLQTANARISRGLADILSKCLASNPSARYSDASELATDLRCHLASLPLRGVGNRSLAERWRKWRRRKPYAMLLLAIGLAALFIVGAIGELFYRDRIRSADGYILQSQEELASKEFSPAITHARAAWDALSLFPWHTDLKSALKRQIAAAQRGQANAALHDLVEQLRFFDNQPLSDRKLADIAAGCTKVWQARQIFTAHAATGAQDRGEEAVEEQLQRDLLDLAVLSSRIEVQLASPEQISEARQAAIRRLNEARQICGPSPWLDLEEGDYRSDPIPRTANVSLDSLPTPKTSWEHYDLGRWLMRHGFIADAQRQLLAAIDLMPDEFWAHFQRMRCDFQLHHFDQALTAANICVALAPRRAECFYNRALCEQSLGHDQEALADFGRALQLDPTFGPAGLARGVLLGRLNRFIEAQADLELAAAHGVRSSEAYYQLARLSLLQHETAHAIGWLQKSLVEDPQHSDALALQAELTSKTSPSK